MLSVLRKATESLKKSGRSDVDNIEQYDVVEDLSAWEIINASPSDDEDCCSLDGDEPEVKQIEEEEGDEDARESRDLAPLNDVVSMKSLSVSPPVTSHADLTRYHLYDGDDDDDDEEEEEEDVYDDDYDDDLVKWKLNRLGKGMKRRTWGVSRVKNSKRLPCYYYNRP